MTNRRREDVYLGVVLVCGFAAAANRPVGAYRMNIPAQDQQRVMPADTSFPPSVRAKVGVVSLKGCPVRLELAKVVNSDHGDEVQIELTNTANEEVRRLQLALFAFSDDGRSQSAELVDVDPSDLPIPTGKRVALTLPPWVSTKFDFLRVGVGATVPESASCGEALSRSKAEEEFEPQEVTMLNPDSSPLRLANAQLMRAIDPSKPLLRVVVLNPGAAVAGNPRVEVFAFAYTAARGPVLRVRADDPHHDPVYPGAAQSHEISIALPKTSTPGVKWKFVVAITNCNVAGRDWTLSEAREKAEAALVAVRR